MPHHYVESGLDNIFLETATRHLNDTIGSSSDSRKFHKVIDRWLVSLPKPLTGAELRFLRLEMEQTQ